MHERAGAIARFENDADAIMASFKKKLTPKQEAELMPMNRHDRRAWAKQHRHDKAPRAMGSKP